MRRRFLAFRHGGSRNPSSVSSSISKYPLTVFFPEGQGMHLVAKGSAAQQVRVPAPQFARAGACQQE
jgi:hypothetical protein